MSSNTLKISGIDEFIKLIDSKMDVEYRNKINRSLLDIKQVHSSINRGCTCRRKFRERHAELAFEDVMKNLVARDREDIISVCLSGESYGVLLITSEDEEQELIRYEAP